MSKTGTKCAASAWLSSQAVSGQRVDDCAQHLVSGAHHSGSGFDLVFSDDQFVGKVRVHKVYENLAGAKVLFTAESGEIRKGDRATTRIN